jgi:glucose-6-phosphate dehydrogenase assembly protein OpcA
MTPSRPTFHPGAATPVPLRDVERELSRRLKLLQGKPGDESPMVRACMSNLIVYCDRADLAEKVSAQVPEVVTVHPARVLLLIAEPGPQEGDLQAAVCVRGHVQDPGRWVVSEQVTLHATGQGVDHLPYAVRSLLIGDLPTNLWWASAQPPPLAGPLLYDLAEPAQQILYDSIGWLEPARGIAATAAWIAGVERGPGQGPWRVVSDLNWRRLKYWRRLLVQAFDPKGMPGALESVTEVLVEHGPHAVIQAWELVSWAAARLGWQVQAGRVQPGVEIAWHVKAPHGPVRLRIKRLAEGPAEVRRVRVACMVNGKPGAVNAALDSERRLAVTLEGEDAAPRTMTVQPQSISELVGRQLTDRERDPVFREAMTVAQVLARSVLG